MQQLLVFSPVVAYCACPTPPYRLTFISDNVIDQWGYSVNDCLQTPQFWLEVIHPDDLAAFEQLLSQLQPNAPQCCEYRIRHQNGSYRWLQNHLQLAVPLDRNDANIIGCWQDITERKQLESIRAHQEQLLQGIIESNYQVLTHTHFPMGVSKSLAIIGDATHADRVYICEHQGADTSTPTQIKLKYTWTRSEVDHPLNQLPWSQATLPQLEAMDWYQTLRVNLPVSGVVSESSDPSRALFRSARIRSILLLPIFFDRQFWGFIGIDHCQQDYQWSPQNVSLLLTWSATVGGALQRHQIETQLVHNAFHDPLTGLPNRSLLLNRLTQALAQTKRYPDYLFAVLFLDLDHFKAINDTLGHNIGDRLLVAIAKRLSNCLRPGDTVARLGGDEFVILLHDIQALNDAIMAAERLREQVCQPFQLGAHEIFANVSIGITLSSNRYDAAEDILEDADRAMYQAKVAGKGQYQIFDKQAATATHNTSVITDGSGTVVPLDFDLHYHPIFSLRSGRIIGLQVFPHWEKRSLPSPLSAAIEAQAAYSTTPSVISQRVIHQACSQLSIWHRQFSNHPLHLSINLDAQHLLQSNFLSDLQHIFKETEFNAHRLKLELSNIDIIEAQDLSIPLLQDLKTSGLQLYLSDFGNNCSALRYLYQLPISAIVIDHTVIHEITTIEKGHALVRSLALLAYNLGIDVIAEGIETTTQLQYLYALNCPYGKGFLLHPPLNAADMGTLLAQDYRLPTPPLSHAIIHDAT